MKQFEYAIIGAGLMGSAAARYLSAERDNVVVIGSAEPENYDSHDGVFASHYDQGRIAYQLGKDWIWAQLGIEAIQQFPKIEAESGIRFHFPIGAIYVGTGEGHTKYATQFDAIIERFGLAVERYGDSAEITANHPHFQFPQGSHAVYEGAPAGCINPRDLARAQLTIAQKQGATLLHDTVTNLSENGKIICASGIVLQAKKVLVATGAFVNCFDLLPEPLDARVKTETIILGRVSESEAARLDFPALLYGNVAPPSTGSGQAEIDEIYMAPPLRYPDGNYYIKLGANTASDQWPETLADMRDWMINGNSDAHKAALIDALTSILPTAKFESFETKRCLVTYTPHTKPYIDQLTDNLFVAACGNGSSAKCSDTLGRLAVDKLLNRWTFDAPPETFQALRNRVFPD